MPRSDAVVLALSGGMDSTSLLGYLLESGFKTVYCCRFWYGSKHNEYENRAGERVLEYYRERHPGVIPVAPMDLTEVMRSFDSALLRSSLEEIPEGHYAATNMKRTVVPCRNLIFASILAGFAESVDVRYIALGVHSGDHYIYPDCRPDFIESLAETIRQATENKVDLTVPFLYDDKESILRYGLFAKVPVPYHLTRTCYKQQEVSCGVCGSCTERLEAFERVGIRDPIEYEVRNGC